MQLAIGFKRRALVVPIKVILKPAVCFVVSDIIEFGATALNSTF